MKITRRQLRQIIREAAGIDEEHPVLTTDWRGNKEWVLPNGMLHRVDGPAVEQPDGTQIWMQRNKIHRPEEEGPAIVYGKNYAAKYEYRLNDKVHRLNGPAIVYRNGEKQWWTNGVLNRLDGPAVEFAPGDFRGDYAYYIDGEELSPEQWSLRTSNMS